MHTSHAAGSAGMPEAVFQGRRRRGILLEAGGVCHTVSPLLAGRTLLRAAAARPLIAFALPLRRHLLLGGVCLGSKRRAVRRDTGT